MGTRYRGGPGTAGWRRLSTPAENWTLSARLLGAEHLLPLAAQAVAVALEDDDLGVVDEAVDHRSDGDRVAEDLGPASWGRFLPEHTTAVALLDRLLHHAVTVVTSGDSYRMKEARTRAGGPSTKA